MAVFRWQRPTIVWWVSSHNSFDKRGNLTIVRRWKYTPWITISMREIVQGVVRHWLWPVMKIRIAKFFPGVLIYENLWVGHLWLNGWGIHDLMCGHLWLNWWGIYGKVSCLIWKYAQQMLVFKRVPFHVIAWPQVLVSLNSRPVAHYRKGGTTPQLRVVLIWAAQLSVSAINIQ